MTNDQMAVTYFHGGIMNPNSSANDIILQGGKTSQEEKLLGWNVCGAGNKYFLCEFREHVRIHKPQVIALLETHISEERAYEVCRRTGHDIWYCGKACEFREAYGYYGIPKILTLKSFSHKSSL